MAMVSSKMIIWYANKKTIKVIKNTYSYNLTKIFLSIYNQIAIFY